LHDVYDQHNELLTRYSEKFGQRVLRLDRLLPGGELHFSDATHFSLKGTQLASELVAANILNEYFKE